jgi:hypothetical protein
LEDNAVQRMLHWSLGIQTVIYQRYQDTIPADFTYIDEAYSNNRCASPAKVRTGSFDIGQPSPYSTIPKESIIFFINKFIHEKTKNRCN